MIEITIKNFLDSKLDIPVVLEKPKETPSKYILFEKTSSRTKNRLTSSTFAFQSNAPSLFEVAELNVTVKEKVKELVELDEIVSVKLNSDYNFTNPETKNYRYQAVFDITHY